MNDARSFSQFKLRMPPALRFQVEQAAEASLRSLNAELVFRLQQSFEGEVPADASKQVPASTTSRVLYLLCMRSGSHPSGSTGSGRLQPIHSLQPVPPYAGIHGRWHHESGIRCLEAGLQYLSCGAGIYLRETHARAPSPEVLARYLRQRQANSLRPCARTLRAGGLSHGL
ncbi:Arc family DNA-binding protein [Pseudomonas nitroreducens]|uniref:Arc family DNA-binding protein n=1 Tax=Pseudomonas nitroreducens TaxID=46680 RepID=A0A5R9ALG4_PSENT|nr:Arc family DNA-binding protein [Pseudomonas nitroreducens]